MNFQKIKIRKIIFEGNEAFSDLRLRWKLKEIKQQRLYFFWRGTFDEKKFEDDLDLLNNFYHDKGYRDFTILKGFSVKLVTGSGNPMVNRSNDKYVKKESYFIRSGENNMIESFKLSKRSLNKLFENSSMDVNRILAYIDSSNLSYKDESDVIKMLEFAFSKYSKKICRKKIKYKSLSD